MFTELIVGTLDEYEQLNKREASANIFRYWYTSHAKKIGNCVQLSEKVKVEASLGKGNFAEVPWVGFRMGRLAPENFMSGIYVVYLFGTRQKRAALALINGVTNVTDHRPFLRTPSVNDHPELERRVSALRQRLQIPSRFCNFELDLGARLPRGKAYQKGYVCGITYERDALPRERTLKADFASMMSLYDSITA